MTVRLNLTRAALALLVSIFLSGCFPSAQTRLEEEKEPHFLAGKNRLNAMDYQGAFESFEKALAVNPGSASAHFELGCLSDQVQAQPAAAIYHYDRYLRLRPQAENAEVVRTRIVACKQELARTVAFGPVTQTLQNEFEKLREANQKLTEELQTWRAYAMRLQALTNVSNLPASMRAAQASVLPAREKQDTTRTQPQPVSNFASVSAPGFRSSAPRSVAAASRSHTIKPGETPSVIARKYGVKVAALMAVNPRLDERRLRVGQTVNLPVQ